MFDIKKKENELIEHIHSRLFITAQSPYTLIKSLEKRSRTRVKVFLGFLIRVRIRVYQYNLVF